MASLLKHHIFPLFPQSHTHHIHAHTLTHSHTHIHMHTHTLTDIEKYYSVDDYEAEEEDEISFPKGAVVDVLQKRLDGWWFIKHEDRTGLAPATFLRKGQPPAKPELVSRLD